MNDWNSYTKSHQGATWFPEEILNQYAKGRILDIGCGIGKHLGSIKNFEEKYGIDPSELAIKEAKKEFPECKFIVGSAYNLPFADNFFDFVYSIDVIEHLKEPEKMLKEAKRVLKKGGIFILQTPNYPIKRIYDFINWINPYSWRKTLRDDPTHFSKFTYFKLKSILKKYFKILELMARNVLFEQRIKVLGKIKKNILGKILGQKLIAICQKE